MVLIVLMFLLFSRIRASCSVCVQHMQRWVCYFWCSGGAPYIVWLSVCRTVLCRHVSTCYI